MSNFLKKLEEEQKQKKGADEQEDEEMEEQKDQIEEMSDVQKVPLPNKMFTKPVDIQQSHQFKKQTNYDPIDAMQYFDWKQKIENRIPVYGGGNKDGHVFLCFHGAGQSAMSFACLTKYLKSTSTVVSYDLRGHGDHHMQQNENDLSEDTLLRDAMLVLNWVIQQFPEQSVILVGHSLGGSIATKLAHLIQIEYSHEDFSKQIQGLFVIDVVEGSAMDALPFMEQIVQNRPPEFKSLQSVVQYGIKSGQVRDIESARLSMPSQVVPKTVGNETKYVWRTDLMATKPYWEQWFKDLTKKFLECRVHKQLLLAASDRMDKELTIAQMQGKFKMVVVDNCGHYIQEDQPQKVAMHFQEFLQTFRVPQKYKEQMVITSVSGKKVVINH